MRLKQFSKRIQKLRTLLRLTWREKSILICGLALIAACISYTNFIYSRVKTLDSFRMNLKGGKEILEASQSAIRNYEEFQLKSLQRSEPHPEEVLFVPDEILNFYEDLSRLVSQSNNRLISLNPISDEIPPARTTEMLSQTGSLELQKFSFKVVVQGNLGAIIDLLKKIEGYRKLISISEFQIHPTGERIPRDGHPTLETEFVLTLYLL